MNLSLDSISKDLILTGVSIAVGANMLNLSKPLKIVYILSMLFLPYYHVYSTIFLNYGMAILSWVLVVKCAKSFNFDLKDPYSNMLFTLRDLRLKGYDPRKLKEEENKIRYLSSFSEVFLLVFRYTSFFIVLLGIQHKFANELSTSSIDQLTGTSYYGMKFLFALYYGILISTSIQNLMLTSCLLYVILSKCCFLLSKWINHTNTKLFLQQAAYEVGDQRPYLLFDKPVYVKSVASFWSDSWHTMLRDIFILVPKSYYKSASRSLKSVLALSAFISSGVFHDYLIFACSNEWCTSSLTYFSVHGIAVLIEYMVFSIVGKHSTVGKAFGMLFGYLVLIYSSHYFVDPVLNLKIFDELYTIYIELPMNAMSNS